MKIKVSEATPQPDRHNSSIETEREQAMRIRKTEENLDAKAEGTCDGLPYNTELVSSAGVSIHFWVGKNHQSSMLPTALERARRNRDIVCASWSVGEPSGFWANEEMR